MNARNVSHLISYLLMVISLGMAASLGVSVVYGDPSVAVRALASAAIVTLAAGVVLALATRGPNDLSRRDGFGVVTLGWVAASVFGALPYVLSGVIPHPVSAVFETMSGFTTTGASVLTDLELLPRGILFWRALTHFFGGMGVLVLCVAILPFLGVGGMQLYRAEMPGPAKDRLTPRIASTAKLLWGVYVLLVVAESVLLRLGGMSWFDAVCHAFATIATGGFSTRSDSIAAFNSRYIEVVIVVFMLLSAVNFALHYRALHGDIRAYFRNPEFRFFFFFWLFSCLFVTLVTSQFVSSRPGTTLRASVFTVTSLMTTTGFTTTDYGHWPAACRLLLLLLMMCGACVGSTSGAIKELRVLVVLKKVIREARLFVQPLAVLRVKMGNKPVREDIVSNIAAFVMAYILTFVLAFLAMCFFMPDLLSAASAVIATLGGVGPGMGTVGPASHYAAVPAEGKIILTGCMLLGRLELYTVLVLFMPSFWKK
ncbi:MAG: TrkH family potassium uptake protein [Kiritimatiellae bacterium]|nr:TrkH family potassium uptake protein [Kiritimatiellia bacterium]